MSKKTIILSSAGLKNVIKDKYIFIFSFGDREIHMSNIFAEFISPIVFHIHHSDPTISQVSFKLPQNTKISRFDETFPNESFTKIKFISSGTITFNKCAVTIKFCTFTNNKVSSTQTTDSKLYCGAAVFLIASKDDLSSNIFFNNEVDGSSLRIYNSFNKITKDSKNFRSLGNNRTKVLLIILLFF